MRVLLLGLVAGCSVVTPPPLVAGHDVPHPKPEGTTSVTLVGGISTGVFTDSGRGLVLRVGHQVDDRTEIGFDVAAGWRSGSRAQDLAEAEKDHQACVARGDRTPRSDMGPFFGGCQLRETPHPPAWLVAVRGFAKLNPDIDRPWLSTTAGAGFGFAESGLSYLTIDLAERFGTGSGTVDGAIGPQLALSLPITGGRAIAHGRRPRFTFYSGIAGGLIANGDGKATGSLEVGTLFGFSPGDDVTLLWASGAGTVRSID